MNKGKRKNQLKTNHKFSSGLGIRVGEEVKKWEKGNLMIFDDAFQHEVWYSQPEYTSLESSTCDGKCKEEQVGSSFANPLHSPRVVLLFDIWHPGLTREEKIVLWELFAPANF